jgi:ArsR family transcriptional regulator, arsenate/arsenite/antimonite-responsive transcriptional repressor
MSTATTQYTLPSHAVKTWALYQLLAGHELLGLAPGEIAKGIGVSPSWVSQNLPALAAETASVERVDGTNRWRLGVPFVRLAFTVSTQLQASKRRLDEVSQRYNVPL